MFPNLTIYQKLMQLLVADTSTLAPAANPPKLKLAKADFTPTLSMVPGDFTEADFDGYSAVASPVNAQLQSLDPLTGDSVGEMKQPAGGYRYETTGTTGLPMTIYGYYLENDGGTEVYGAEKFAEPIILVATNQSIGPLTPTFRQLSGSIV